MRFPQDGFRGLHWAADSQTEGPTSWRLQGRAGPKPVPPALLAGPGMVSPGQPAQVFRVPGPRNGLGRSLLPAWAQPCRLRRPGKAHSLLFRHLQPHPAEPPRPPSSEPGASKACFCFRLPLEARAAERGAGPRSTRTALLSLSLCGPKVGGDAWEGRPWHFEDFCLARAS